MKLHRFLAFSAILLAGLSQPLAAQYAPSSGGFQYAIATETLTSGTLPFASSGTVTVAFLQGNWFDYVVAGSQLSPAVGTYSYSQTSANVGTMIVTRTNISPAFSPTQVWKFTGPTSGTFTMSGSYDGYTGSAQGTFTVTFLQPSSEASVPASTMINVSTRGLIGTGGQILIGGFVISGTLPETVLVRGVGPALASFGVTGTLATPQLALFDSSGNAIATNTAWGNKSVIGSSPVAATIQQATSANFTSVGAFGLPTSSADCAFVAVLPPGAYTLQVSGVGNSTGIGLVEAYAMP